MNKAIFFSLCLTCIISTAESVYAQRSKNKSQYEYELVYESGNAQNGNHYAVYEKKNEFGFYEYFISEGKRVNGKLNGFGKVLRFHSPQKNKVDFLKREMDSARAADELNLLPLYFTQSRKEEDALTLKQYDYSIGYYKDDRIVRGAFFDSKEEKRMEGIFDEYGRLDYGSYTKKYKDTLLRGFLCMREIELDRNASCNKTGLRFFIADSSFSMIPFFDNQPVRDLYVFPMSEYHSDRKPAVNMPFNNGIYNGEAHNGKPEGLGEWISDDGEFVGYGYFKNGEPHGLFCKNFHQINEKNNQYAFTEHPAIRPMKGIAVGIFTNGKPGKMYVRWNNRDYIGEVNEKFLPEGSGKLINTLSDMTESGTFASGKLNGYGTRIFADKSTEKGYFSNGELSSGSFKRSASSLRKYEVVKVKGKRLLVMEKIYSENSSYAKLSDGSFLLNGDDFSIDPGGNDDFFSPCGACGGSGFVAQVVTTRIWTKSEVLTHRRVERIGSYDYLYTSTEIKPVYNYKTTETTTQCGRCRGAGRFLNVN